MPDPLSSWLARDTQSLIRALGGDEQSGGFIKLLFDLLPTVQVGDPFQVLPQAGIPTAQGRVSITNTGTGGYSRCMFEARGSEVHIWAVVSEEPAVAFLEPISVARTSNGSAPLVNPVYAMPTFQILTLDGNPSPGAPPATAPFSELIESLFGNPGWRRIPRGYRLMYWGDTVNTDLHVQYIMSDISPSQEVAG